MMFRRFIKWQSIAAAGSLLLLAGCSTSSSDTDQGSGATEFAEAQQKFQNLTSNAQYRSCAAGIAWMGLSLQQVANFQAIVSQNSGNAGSTIRSDAFLGGFLGRLNSAVDPRWDADPGKFWDKLMANAPGDKAVDSFVRNYAIPLVNQCGDWARLMTTAHHITHKGVPLATIFTYFPDEKLYPQASALISDKGLPADGFFQMVVHPAAIGPAEGTSEPGWVDRIWSFIHGVAPFTGASDFDRYKLVGQTLGGLNSQLAEGAQSPQETIIAALTALSDLAKDENGGTYNYEQKKAVTVQDVGGSGSTATIDFGVSSLTLPQDLEAFLAKAVGASFVDQGATVAVDNQYYSTPGERLVDPDGITNEVADKLNADVGVIVGGVIGAPCDLAPVEDPEAVSVGQ